MVFPAQHPLILRGDQTVELLFLRSPAELPIESQISASMLRKKKDNGLLLRLALPSQTLAGRNMYIE